MDSANLNAIISAVSGLTGIGIGALLTHLRERRAENITDNRDTSYLAILVVTHLDRFANGCMSVAFDDGRAEGRPAGEDGVDHRPTVRPPEFAPLDINVEWHVLPRELMYDILEIPAKQDHPENQLSGVMEFDDPPQYAEFFMHRRRNYADLGLQVSCVAKRLREFAQMQIGESIPGDWNRDAAMQKIIDKLDAERSAQDKR
ncbi:hypothetical protein [Achromobacter xylosoxidans]|uniref:hypothetical protein n=1 Tax=Alcaligenes xylosoxydans xylosoxydans TaxID=85698 RepID=UPI0006C552B6|nr:hypothetical protein [Achromobacter xylosoxidans]CUI57924.1 Uncharacterised protein [Achromobacter xylosoxidans]